MLGLAITSFALAGITAWGGSLFCVPFSAVGLAYFWAYLKYDWRSE